jgi:plastocyanin
MNQDFSSNTPTVVSGGSGPLSSGGSSKKKFLFMGVAAVLIIAVGAVLFTTLHKPGSGDDGKVVAISNTVANVNVSASGYSPQTITVKQGQQVTFTNSDATSRQLTADPSSLPGFSTVEPLDQGDTYTYIFDQKGTFKYYDATDPTHFVGTVTVN